MNAERNHLQNQGRRERAVTLFVALSLLAHVGVFLALSALRATPPPPKAAKVEVEYLEPAELRPPPVEERRGPKAEEKLRDQIVEQQKQLNDEKPEDSRFLSAFDQKVLQQTRAERVDKFTNKAEGGKPDEGRKEGEKEQTSLEKADLKRRREKGELPKLQDLTPKFALEPGPKAPVTDNPGDPSATDDHLKDVKSGLQTLLSTREFVYYAYYARIKEALRQHWEPTVREKVKIVYRSGRTIASAKDRVTQVMVTLDKNGALVRIEVLGKSGVEDLDSAAVEAFRDAAPFPNPPKGMVEPDGTVKIRWDFVLEA